MVHDAQSCKQSSPSVEGSTLGKSVPSGALENEDGWGADSGLKNEVPLRIREANDGGPIYLVGASGKRRLDLFQFGWQRVSSSYLRTFSC